MNTDFLALAYKIPNITSQKFVNIIKSQLNKQGFQIHKIGFSGTLDPFAQGQLILGVNGYTKLLPHIKKDYKTYQAVLFLGMNSTSLDIENIINITETRMFNDNEIFEATKNLYGKVVYNPPKFSAKHINGVRAYELARKGEVFETKEVAMFIRTFKILCYNHPFLSFEVEVSEGGYVRSIGEIITKNLGVKGGLCYLERVSEGEWNYKTHLQQLLSSNNLLPRTFISNLCEYNEADKGFFDWHNAISLEFYFNQVKQNTKLLLLDIKNALKYDTISLLKYAKESFNGATITLESKLCKEIFAISQHQKDSFLYQESQNDDLKRFQTKVFLADFGSHFAIISVSQNGEVKYIVNRINKC